MRRKQRLTITLPKDMLDQIDGLVDYKETKNRSHAIEQLIRTSLVPTVSEAVILGGGGKMGSLPALKKFKGVTLVETMVSHMSSHNIKKVWVAMGKNNGQVEALLKNGSKYNLSLSYVDEPNPLGTGGVIKSLSKFINKPFLVIHGDVLTNINLTECIKFHQEEGTLVTMAVKPRSWEKSFGKVLLEGNKITKFVGKTDEAGVNMVNTGVYVMEPEIFSFINNSPASLEKDVFSKLAEKGELTAYLFQGVWFDISSQKNYKLALKRWRSHG